MISNLINITTFGLLVLAAIIWRKRTDWHRRLMLIATILLAGVACFRVTVFIDGDRALELTALFVTAHFALCLIGDWLIGHRFRPVWLLGPAAWYFNMWLTFTLVESSVGEAAGRALFG